MKQKIILDLCGGSGSWSDPYKKAGYRVENITLPDFDILLTTFEDGLIYFRDGKGTSLIINPKEVYGILAAPPCTEFSIARNYKFKRDLPKGMEVVDACLKIIEACKPVFYAIENPVGKLKDFLGEETWSFQPWEFGDPWTKRTLLWGNFYVPIGKYHNWEDVPKIKGLYVRPGRKTASIAFNHLGHKKLIKQLDPFTATDDASFRAITPPGFAKAFYEANK